MSESGEKVWAEIDVPHGPGVDVTITTMGGPA